MLVYKLEKIYLISFLTNSNKIPRKLINNDDG